MSFDYATLKSLPEDLDIGILFDFLGKVKNASLRPGIVESDCPPVLFWWFEENNKEVNRFIADTVKSFPWEDAWEIEDAGNGKWLLFPSRIREAEQVAKGIEDENIKVTTAGVAWLMNNDPDFGRRANQDLDRFRKYFRAKIEAYLKRKERGRQGGFL